MFVSGGGTLEINSQDEPRRFVLSNTVYNLNLKSSKWEVFSELKSKRYAHQSTIIGDKMFLVGGFNDTDLADTAVIPISKQVKTVTSRIPAMHNRRSYFGMCSFARCIFVAGGYNDNDKTLDKCEVYSTESCEWIEASSMNTKRRSFALIYFQDKIWAIGDRQTK